MDTVVAVEAAEAVELVVESARAWWERDFGQANFSMLLLDQQDGQTDLNSPPDRKQVVVAYLQHKAWDSFANLLEDRSSCVDLFLFLFFSSSLLNPKRKTLKKE